VIVEVGAFGSGAAQIVENVLRYAIVIVRSAGLDEPKLKHLRRGIVFGSIDRGRVENRHASLLCAATASKLPIKSLTRRSQRTVFG
jgi:NOL1/NOP2/fmu family ribosome biogenesis protein